MEITRTKNFTFFHKPRRGNQPMSKQAQAFSAMLERRVRADQEAPLPLPEDSTSLDDPASEAPKKLEPAPQPKAPKEPQNGKIWLSSEKSAPASRQEVQGADVESEAPVVRSSTPLPGALDTDPDAVNWNDSVSF